MLNDLETILAKYADTINSLQARIAHLEAQERVNMSSGTTPPSNPVDCQIWIDTTDGLAWRWSSGINRWMSLDRKLLSMGFSQVGASVTSPSGGTQLLIQDLPFDRDVYIYQTHHQHYVTGTLNTSNTWTIYNDYSSQNLATLPGAAGNTTLFFTLPVGVVKTKGGSIRSYTVSTGSPGQLAIYGGIAELVELY